MSNSNHSAKFINMLIALMASIAIALTCIVPTALAEDGDGTDDNNGGSTVQPAGPVPNIIITNFTYGDGSVAVGTNFDLGFTFQNMGKVAVGNMVVTVDGGENFAISGGTNTFYYDSLWAGYSLTQTVPMQVLSSAKNGAQGHRYQLQIRVCRWRHPQFQHFGYQDFRTCFAARPFRTGRSRASRRHQCGRGIHHFHGIREQGQGGCIQCRSVHRG